MQDLLPKSPSPITPATCQGIIDGLYAVRDGLRGSSDGKLYHKFQEGSREEGDHAEGAAWAAQRLMENVQFVEDRDPHSIPMTLTQYEGLQSEMRRLVVEPRMKKV